MSANNSSSTVVPLNGPLLTQAMSQGQPLPETFRRQAEIEFAADFSDVRVHVGPEAEQVAAIAFTQGSDIFFRPGAYDPNSPRGREILGHELAHVVQQRTGRVPP